MGDILGDSLFIKNSEELVSHGQVWGRETVIDIIEHALAAAHPYAAVLNLVHLNGDILSVGELKFDLSKRGKIYLLGAGKATFPIAKALEEILGDRIHDGVIIVKEGQEGTLGRVKMRKASHPLPSKRGFIAAKEMKSVAERAQRGDIVFCALTGGNSALAPLPAFGITLDEKRKVTELLLRSGANIREMNAVRKHLSAIKGGKLAQCIFPAEVVNLAVSDASGDPLDYVTNPTVPDTSTFADAIQTLKKYDLLEQIPKSTREYLLNATPDMETPKDFGDMPVHTFLLIKSSVPCEEANKRATELRLPSMILTSTLEGESREVSRVFTSMAREIRSYNRPLPFPCVVIAGGETTVSIRSDCGRGGPNQEFSLSTALDLVDQEGVVVAAIDTDGTDGPTEIAGGIVDSSTMQRAREKRLDLVKSLLSHDASTVLKELDDAVITGHTGTNVNDLIVMLVI